MKVGESTDEWSAQFAQKMHAIQADVKTLGFDKENSGQHYKYTSLGAVLAFVRPLIEKHRMAITATERNIIGVGTYKTRGGEANWVHTKDRIKITDIDTGYSQWFEGVGMGADNGDKPVGKAQSNSLKYAIQGIFLASWGDDPEATDERGMSTAGVMSKQDKSLVLLLQKSIEAAKNGEDMAELREKILKTNTMVQDEVRESFMKKNKELKDGEKEES